MKLSVSARNRIFRQCLKEVERLEKQSQTCPIELYKEVMAALTEEKKLLQHFSV